MTRKILTIASLLVVLALVGTGVVVASSLPADATLPVHWGLDGEADRFADKWTALLLPSAITAVVSTLFFFLPSVEPRQQGLERSRGLYFWGWSAMLLMAVAIQFALVSEALSWDVSASRVIAGSLGVLLILTGNQLGKSRSMYTVGIRTPWTLASEDVWIKTHRLGGKLMVAAGLVSVLASALIPIHVLTPIMLSSVAIIAIVPVGYSYLLWRRGAAVHGE
jgi:uncharacterized membrane protein